MAISTSAANAVIVFPLLPGGLPFGPSSRPVVPPAKGHRLPRKDCGWMGPGILVQHFGFRKTGTAHGMLMVRGADALVAAGTDRVAHVGHFQVDVAGGLPHRRRGDRRVAPRPPAPGGEGAPEQKKDHHDPQRAFRPGRKPSIQAIRALTPTPAVKPLNRAVRPVFSRSLYLKAVKVVPSRHRVCKPRTWVAAAQTLRKDSANGRGRRTAKRRVLCSWAAAARGCGAQIIETAASGVMVTPLSFPRSAWERTVGTLRVPDPTPGEGG